MKMIPAVSTDLLMLAERKVAEDHEAGLRPDPTVSIVSALHDKCDPKELIAIANRLTALAHLIVDGDGKAWTVAFKGKDYTLVHGALIRAAATAPLTETKIVGDLRFGPEILEIALRYREPDGSA